MNWLVDTQLPHQLATALKKRGHRALHASELPRGNASADADLLLHAETNEAIVVSKDADFIASRALKGKPGRLVYMATGNIRNAELILLFMHCLDGMCTVLAEEALIELDRDGFTVR